MKLSTRLLNAAVMAVSVFAIASPNADALPWASANPYAAGAAGAYAEAYAEALAIAHPDPEAYALAASADDCATIGCHASCGLMIVGGTDCTLNTGNSYAGPYNTTCLCSADSKLNKYYAACMDCGWTLWKYYGPYVTSALAACSTLSTEPTGTLRCSTTLTDSYTIDTNVNACEYTGGCTATKSGTSETTSATSSSFLSSSTTSSTTTSISTAESTSTSSISTRNTLTETTYTATTYTVTTDMSLTYSYTSTLSGSTSDCFTSTKSVSTNDFSFVMTSWTEYYPAPVYADRRYRVWSFFNFTEDYTDVTDIQLLTGTTSATAPIKPDSEVYVNLEQGAYYVLFSAVDTAAGYSNAFLITKGGVKYLLAYGCSTTGNPLKLMNLPEGTYDVCVATGSGYYYESVCKHKEVINTVYEFRPNGDHAVTSSELLESSLTLSSFESSIMSSAAITSSEATPSSQSTDSSAQFTSTQSNEASTQSNEASTQSNEASTQSTEVSTQSNEASTQYPEASSQSTTESLSETATRASSTNIFSSSSVASVEPTFAGTLDSGAPQWKLSIPGALVPRSLVDLIVTRNGSIGTFDYTEASVAINGESAKTAQISVTAESIVVSFDTEVEESDVVEIDFAAKIGSGRTWTSTAHLAITTLDDKKLSKREELIWDLISTITSEAEFSSDASSASSEGIVSYGSSKDPAWSSVSSLSSVASVSSAPSSSSSLSEVSSAPPEYGNSTTSTATQEVDSTTIVTVISCSDDVCSTTAVTTGITVITKTFSDVVTTYTTYCPIETEKASTTVITVTSCSNDICTKFPKTTGVTVVTTTIEGTKTTFTTYCLSESSSHPEDSTAKATTTTSKGGEITTETKKVTSTVASPTTSTGRAVESSSSPVITTFEGAAVKVVGSTVFGLLLGLLFI